MKIKILFLFCVLIVSSFHKTKAQCGSIAHEMPSTIKYYCGGMGAAVFAVPTTQWGNNTVWTLSNHNPNFVAINITPNSAVHTPGTTYQAQTIFLDFFLTTVPLGSYSYTLTATNGNCVLEKTINVSLICDPNSSITTTALPNSSNCTNYATQTLQTNLCQPQWRVLSGSLPQGLELTADGQIRQINANIPPAPGTYTVGIEAYNSRCSVSRTYTFSICACGNLNLNQSQPPALCNSYTGTLSHPSFNPANGQIVWTTTTAPTNGLTLNSNGTITGTPTSIGNITFSNIVATQNGVSSCPQNIPFQVNCVPADQVTLSDNNLNRTCTNAGYINTQITAIGLNTNCVLPIIWSAEGLPNGWKIDPDTGLISGTTLDSENNDIIITATQGTCSYSRNYTSELSGIPQAPISVGTPNSNCPNQLSYQYISLSDINYGFTDVSIPISGVVIMSWDVSKDSNGIVLGFSYSMYSSTQGLTPFEVIFHSPCGDVTVSGGFYVQQYQGSSQCNDNDPWWGRASLNPNPNTVIALQITPNPVVNNLKLSGNSEMEYAVRLQDAQGKQIAAYQGKLAEVEAQMNKQVPSLKAGMYFVQFQPREGKAEVKKFVKIN